MEKRKLIKVVGLIIYIAAILGVLQLYMYIEYLDSVNPFVHYGLEEMFCGMAFVLLIFFGIGWVTVEFAKVTQKAAIEELKKLMGEQYGQRYEQLDVFGGVLDIAGLCVHDAKRIPQEKTNAALVALFLIAITIFALVIGD